MIQSDLFGRKRPILYQPDLYYDHNLPFLTKMSMNTVKTKRGGNIQNIIRNALPASVSPEVASILGLLATSAMSYLLQKGYEKGSEKLTKKFKDKVEKSNLPNPIKKEISKIQDADIKKIIQTVPKQEESKPTKGPMDKLISKKSEDIINNILMGQGIGIIN